MSIKYDIIKLSDIIIQKEVTKYMAYNQSVVWILISIIQLKYCNLYHDKQMIIV